MITWVLLAVAVGATCMWLRHAPDGSTSQTCAGVLLLVLALVGPMAITVSG
ncbi:membrane protein [Mycobacterium phage Funsized]|nr:membrane protein [Mycobacterium phage Funsized]